MFRLGDPERRRALFEVSLGDAAALLFPVDWPEPFGLVMIEAMACGTPVIAFRRGSVPEILEDGTSGFVVDTIEEAARAVRRVASLDRAKVRAEFERRFTVERMVAGPGSKTYGRLSVMLQWRYRMELMFIVPPTAFDPPPHSSMYAYRGALP